MIIVIVVAPQKRKGMSAKIIAKTIIIIITMATGKTASNLNLFCNLRLKILNLDDK